MLKLFISQPMKGKTDEEILQERNRIISMVQAQYGSVQVIDSFRTPEDVRSSMNVRKPMGFRLSKRRTEL